MNKPIILVCLFLSTATFSSAKTRVRPRRTATPAEKAAAVKSSRHASLQAYKSGRRADAPPEAPPSYSKPGALIRTEGGRLPVYAAPGDIEANSVASRGPIVQDAGSAKDVARSLGVNSGASDKAPSPSPKPQPFVAAPAFNPAP